MTIGINECKIQELSTRMRAERNAHHICELLDPYGHFDCPHTNVDEASLIDAIEYLYDIEIFKIEERCAAEIQFIESLQHPTCRFKATRSFLLKEFESYFRRRGFDEIASKRAAHSMSLGFAI